MAIDFKSEFGVNAGYVESLFERWRVEPDKVDPEWRRWFEDVANGKDGQTAQAAQPDQAAAAAEPTAETPATPAATNGAASPASRSRGRRPIARWISSSLATTNT